MGIGAGALVVGALGMNVSRTPCGDELSINGISPAPQVKNHMEENNLAFIAISAAAVGVSMLLIITGLRTWVLFMQFAISEAFILTASNIHILSSKRLRKIRRVGLGSHNASLLPPALHRPVGVLDRFRKHKAPDEWVT